LLFALLVLVACVAVISGNAAGETFADVDLYLKEEADPDTDGYLTIELPTSGNTNTAPVAAQTNEQNQWREVASWYSNGLHREANLSGEWSGQVLVNTNRGININLRFTLVQDGTVIDSFETGQVTIAEGESEMVAGSGSLSHTALGDDPLELRIESNIAYDGPPPTPPVNVSVELEYYGSGENFHGRITLPMSHMGMAYTNLLHNPNHLADDRLVEVWFDVRDSFGRDALRSSKGSYIMTMAPQGEGQWEAVTASVTSRSGYYEVKFEWDYEGHSLPAGDNPYDVTVQATDELSGATWTFAFTARVYIEPIPDVSLSTSTQSRNVDPGNSRSYTITVTNTGTGEDTFLFSTSGTLNGWGVQLSKEQALLDASDSTSVTLTITAPAEAAEGERDETIFKAEADSDSSIHDTLTFRTTARVPPPDYSFEIRLQHGENWDIDCDCFPVVDRAPVEITLTITNHGNRPNSYILALDGDTGLSLDLETSRVTDVAVGESQDIEATLEVGDDFLGTLGSLEVEVTSEGDSNSEYLFVDMRLELSGQLSFGSTKFKLTAPRTETTTGEFTIMNINPRAAIQGYFHVEGVNNDDNPAQSWIEFRDDDNEVIGPDNLLVLAPGQQMDIRVRAVIPGDAAIDTYRLEVWMVNAEGAAISSLGPQTQFRIETSPTPEKDETPWALYGVVLLVLLAGAGGAAYYMRGSDMDYDYEDDYYDDEEDEEDAPPAAPRMVNVPAAAAPVAAPTEAAVEAPAMPAVTAEVPAAAPVVAEAPVVAAAALPAVAAEAAVLPAVSAEAAALPAVAAELPVSTELRPYGTVQKPLTSALLTMFTIVYGFIWGYRIHKENKECADVGPGGPLGLLFMFIPGWNVVRSFLFTNEVALVQQRAGIQPTVSAKTWLWYFPGGCLMGVGILIWISKLQKALNATWMARGAPPLLPAGDVPAALPAPAEIAPPMVAAQPAEVTPAHVEAAPPMAAAQPAEVTPAYVEPAPPMVAPMQPEPVAVAVEPVVAQPAVAEPVAVAVEPVVAQPAVAEPVAVAVEPVVAQPVVAEPVAVAAEPVVAQPVVAEPVAVAVESVVAQPVVAEPVAVADEPMVAQPVVAEPLAVAVEPVVAEPVVAEAVAVTAQPVAAEAADDEADFEFD